MTVGVTRPTLKLDSTLDIFYFFLHEKNVKKEVIQLNDLKAMLFEN